MLMFDDEAGALSTAFRLDRRRLKPELKTPDCKAQKEKARNRRGIPPCGFRASGIFSGSGYA
jgi:hypothetical protein